MVSRAHILSYLAFATLAFATPVQHQQRDSRVVITSLSKNVTSTGGSGDVAAAGSLTPFGNIGIGCGINWEAEKSYGGGLTAGSADYGLGGGFTVTTESMTVGLGIGYNGVNASTSIELVGQKNGTFELVLESSEETVCSPVAVAKGMKFVISCKTL